MEVSNLQYQCIVLVYNRQREIVMEVLEIAPVTPDLGHSSYHISSADVTKKLLASYPAVANAYPLVQSPSDVGRILPSLVLAA